MADGGVTMWGARARDRDDYDRCLSLLSEGSKTFRLASRLLPARILRPTAALYAFLRTADDAVDDAGAGPEAMARLSRRLDAAYAAGPCEDFVDRAFVRAVTEHRIPRPAFELLLEGFAWDLHGREYTTLRDVEDYAVRVAGTVGAMMTLVMGVRSRAALSRACDLGVAMQLTNIARDVGEDARRGRVYLPTEWLVEAGSSPAELLARPSFRPALGVVVERLLRRADVLYRRAEAGIPALPAECRGAIWAARRLYADIGGELRRRGLDSVSERAVVPASRKAALVLRAAASAALAPAQEHLLQAPPIEAGRELVDACAS